ncbi:MAG: 2Fe-2S iron-sulfur cluster-binding protein [bacterium]
MAQIYPVILTNGVTAATIEVAEDEYILDVAWQAGYDLPASCLLGWCVTCAGRLLSGEVDHTDSLRYYSADQEEGFILLCTAKPRAPLHILTHQKDACRAHRQRLGLPTPLG